MSRKVEFVQLDRILKRDIPLDYAFDGRLIAASIITSSQILHALPANIETKYHRDILRATGELIYPNKTSIVREFQLLSVHYVIESIDREEVDSAYIYSPAYITPNQAEMLNCLVKQLRACGFKLGLIIGDYNPFKDCDDNELQKFFVSPYDIEDITEIEEYIINLYRQYGRIKEYVLPFGEEVIVPLEEQYKM